MKKSSHTWLLTDHGSLEIPFHPKFSFPSKIPTQNGRYRSKVFKSSGPSELSWELLELGLETCGCSSELQSLYDFQQIT